MSIRSVFLEPFSKHCKECGTRLWPLGFPVGSKTFVCRGCGAVQMGLHTVQVGQTVIIGDIGGDPGSPVNGQIWLNGTTLRMRSGGANQDIGGASVGIPSGIIVAWSGLLSAVPAGWAVCNGIAAVPDLRNKFLYGWDGSTDPGATGGLATHLHTGAGGHQHASDGSHAHAGTDFSHNAAGSHQHDFVSQPHAHVLTLLNIFYQTGGTLIGVPSVNTQATTIGHQHVADGSHGHNTHALVTGGGHVHDVISDHTHDAANNLPPYAVVAWIKKV